MATPASATSLPTDIRLMNATALLLTVLAGAVLAALALVWLAQRPLFALKAIRIEGDLTHNSVLTIRANAAPKLAGNFFTFDLASGRRAFESVPWVRQAVVSRVWPDRLAVRLEEHRAVALWATPGSDDGAADKLVNSFGEVFEANLGDVVEDALPTLRGPDGSAPQTLAMFGRLQPVFAAMGAHVEALELSGRGSWRVELDTGAAIELGRGTDADVLARTQRFVGTLPEVKQLFPQHPLLAADLRHRDGYAVRLKGITTAGDAPIKSPSAQ